MMEKKTKLVGLISPNSEKSERDRQTNLYHRAAELLSADPQISDDFQRTAQESDERSRTIVALVKDDQSFSMIEMSAAPLLLFPKSVSAKNLVLKSYVVPLSGIRKRCESLRLALGLANLADQSVSLLHVTSADQASCGESCELDSMGDQFHHEYRYLLDRVVSAGSPTSNLRERNRVSQFHHLVGDPTVKIHEYMKERPESVLVIELEAGWQEREGTQGLIHFLLENATYPVLIAKVPQRMRSRLTIGPNFKAA